jgi:segregation and condensation protein B
MKELAQQIEAILFFKGDAVTVKELAKTLGQNESAVSAAVEEIKTGLAGRGIVLMDNVGELKLATAPSVAPIIETLIKEELHRDLGKAGLETLSIILYRGPVTRGEVDFIRGVNSQFIVRNLLVRGLVERVDNPKDRRTYLYKPTLELLSYLGIANLSELPEYEAVRSEMEAREAALAADKSNDGESAPTTETTE